MKKGKKPVQDSPLTPEELGAFFDGELSDPAELERLESLIRSDPHLLAQMHAHDAIRTQLRRIPKVEAPPYLKSKLIRLSAKHRRRASAYRIARLGAASCLSLVAAVLIVLGLFRDQADSGEGIRAVYAAAIADHASYLPEDAGAELFSSATPEIEPWLAARLNFTPRIPQWEWADLKSARSCSLEGKKVALVRYQCGENPMSLYIWPEERAEARVAEVKQDLGVPTPGQGVGLAAWSHHNLMYLLVADRESAQVLDHLQGALYWE